MPRRRVRLKARARRVSKRLCLLRGVSENDEISFPRRRSSSRSPAARSPDPCTIDNPPPRVPAITVPSPTSWKISYAANNPRPSFVPLPNSPLHTVLRVSLFRSFSSFLPSFPPSSFSRLKTDRFGASFRFEISTDCSLPAFLFPLFLPRQVAFKSFKSRVSSSVFFFRFLPLSIQLLPPSFGMRRGKIRSQISRLFFASL